MRINTCIAAVVASLFVASVSAQPQTGLYQWQVSADGGATWSSSITLNPGDPYRIRGVGSWTDGPVQSHGFAGVGFEQIDLIGADDSDVFGGVSGPGGMPAYRVRRQGVLEGWVLLTGTGPSESGVKIESVSPTGRTYLGQLQYSCFGGGIPNPGYIFDNPMLLIDLDARAGDPKALTISAIWARLGTPPSNEFKIYINQCGTNKKPQEEATLHEAHVWIRPNASCVPDFNGDGLVDFADYLEFLSFFDTQDFRADLNRDGLVDFADYLEFLNAFDAGC